MCLIDSVKNNPGRTPAFIYKNIRANMSRVRAHIYHVYHINYYYEVVRRVPRVGIQTLAHTFIRTRTPGVGEERICETVKDLRE
jgi:hypothetical protein